MYNTQSKFNKTSFLSFSYALWSTLFILLYYTKIFKKNEQCSKNKILWVFYYNASCLKNISFASLNKILFQRKKVIRKTNHLLSK